jgi:hypothetical protein
LANIITSFRELTAKKDSALDGFSEKLALLTYSNTSSRLGAVNLNSLELEKYPLPCDVTPLGNRLL